MAMTSKSLLVKKLALPGVLMITPQEYTDERGFFAEIYNSDVFKEVGIHTLFVQDSVSYSKKDVLRGLHFQKNPHMQAKLVRCVQGVIFDVVADIDPASPTYGQHIGVTLSGEEQNMLYIPGEYAHGFCVISDVAYVEYKLSELHYPEEAGGVMYNDSVLKIEWPINNPVISEKDTKWPPLPKQNDSD